MKTEDELVLELIRVLSQVDKESNLLRAMIQSKMRNCTIVVASCVAFLAACISGFPVDQMESRRTSFRTKAALQASFRYEGENHSPSEALLRQRTCVRTLLTQRAIQSFMDLLISIRDPHTVDWLQVRRPGDICYI